MRCKKITVVGRVQGVGFREFVRKEASKLGGVVGYVKNLKNGDLQVVVGGDNEKINQIIKRCKAGPLLSDVKEVIEEEMDSEEEYNGFFIKY